MPGLSLENLPGWLSPSDLHSLARGVRVFGPQSLQRHLNHLERLKFGKPWFAYVDNNGARCFTRLVKLAKPVRNPRSITGSEKYVVRADLLTGFLF